MALETTTLVAHSCGCPPSCAVSIAASTKEILPMSDQVNSSHSLALKLLATAALVATLLWGAWITQQVTSSPKQRIVTVRLAETIGTFF